jgi:hypothetical protein
MCMSLLNLIGIDNHTEEEDASLAAQVCCSKA